MSDFSLIRIQVEKRVGVITMTNPPGNTLSQRMIKELDIGFEKLYEDSNVKVILLHGEDRFFAAGADIKELSSIKPGERFTDMAKEGQRVFRKIERLTKPVIAAIHGAALGGGLELAMACHMRLVTNDAKLGLPELQLGLIPGFAGTQRLPELVGKAKAAEMLLTSEPVLGTEAVAIGLANRTLTIENYLDEAKRYAEKIASKGQHSISYTLELLNETKNIPLEYGQQKEADYFGEISKTDDSKEGIKAFIEKRAPLFTDK